MLPAERRTVVTNSKHNGPSDVCFVFMARGTAKSERNKLNLKIKKNSPTFLKITFIRQPFSRFTR